MPNRQKPRHLPEYGEPCLRAPVEHSDKRREAGLTEGNFHMRYGYWLAQAEREPARLYGPILPPAFLPRGQGPR